jgi:hypothetical protein
MRNTGKAKRRTELSPATDFTRQRGFDRVLEVFRNLQQKPFTISELVAIARELRPYAEAEARRRQRHGQTAPGRKKNTKTKAPFGARDFVSRCVGLSHQTLRKAEIVVDAGQDHPNCRLYVDLMDQTSVADALRCLQRKTTLVAPKPIVRRAFDARQFVEEIIRAALGSSEATLP